MLKRREGAFYLTYHQAAFEAARSVSSCLALLSEIKSEKIASLGRLQRMEAGKSCVIRVSGPSDIQKGCARLASGRCRLKTNSDLANTMLDGNPD
ncbi:hypothetical protein GUITHDRAFT_99419 [Guillardia theta CCMP2712]|nr:hypothetical protein GUITHDRAFT_99415 [Guillardia theta CCMP2712]XP_005841744.1 hypothetical protein GUITHDRAFT_99417 [Guillardia theta CCMP2712]XP_005841746.1 hypothetical protein GUITHDRAFT_99419 [Guillardia theta CCMP2712]EKX54762.1 hypothetical protein GUITHDRAFT_99415 [Guillardia theta CCMP2712]EKX54764.1 hypothetical protein GUITHDRAFT_99417 [Guillardia theta CCMP2712]EKX54766.1 hypothetical protein GUITHDRAFT_99419 [Guillardia theta CCMP2712]|eukprot:XP_005841742.1 hypothetical protein GUITHDRAFT_99415 [Guillardia theta CCMP2712]